MFCIECGAKLPDSAKFCFQCGAKIGIDNSIAIVESIPETKLVPMKCTNCGGYVEFKNNLETAQCPFCNSTFIVERAIQNFTSSNGGRDFNLLLGLAESNIKSKLYLDALDYLWQAHILASLAERQQILVKINELLNDAFVAATIPFKILLLKYKVLHGLEECDSNFIRRIRSYEYSLKSTYLCRKMDKYNQWLSDNSDWDLVITITKDMYKLMSKMNGKKYETQDGYSMANSQYNNNKKVTMKEEKKKYIIGTEVNAREKASMDSRIVGTFALGEKVDILVDESEWAKVKRINGQTCYVYKKYLGTQEDLNKRKASKL